MDIKLQSLLVSLMIIEVILDQIRNALLQSYYDQLGLENVFLLWWLGFYLENIGTDPKTKNFFLESSCKTLKDFGSYSMWKFISPLKRDFQNFLGSKEKLFQIRNHQDESKFHQEVRSFLVYMSKTWETWQPVDSWDKLHLPSTSLWHPLIKRSSSKNKFDVLRLGFNI